mmetsp:Transcript_17311/g.20031  ORF Transcript_17311/g.20031 Transcript_17311/m.20031 type:complete len:150 (-) Transcript_17311:149-598(-)
MTSLSGVIANDRGLKLLFHLRCLFLFKKVVVSGKLLREVENAIVLVAEHAAIIKIIEWYDVCDNLFISLHFLLELLGYIELVSSIDACRFVSLLMVQVEVSAVSGFAAMVAKILRLCAVTTKYLFPSLVVISFLGNENGDPIISSVQNE